MFDKELDAQPLPEHRFIKMLITHWINDLPKEFQSKYHRSTP